jgi:hypothetical protein
MFSFGGMAQAQPTVVSKSEARELTLSGNSLRNIERLTVDNNFDEFFLNENQAEISLSNAPASASYFRPEQDVWNVTEDINVQVNEPLAEPVNALPFRQPIERYDGIGRVEVQYEVLN